MNTTKIKIKPHLAEYCIGKWGNDFTEPVEFPSYTDLHVTVYDLLQKTKLDYDPENYNLEIVIPNRKEDSEGFRKCLEYYKYLSVKSCQTIEKRIAQIFWIELHEELMYWKEEHAQNYEITVNYFICKYRIESISEDALLKNFYRWRINTKKREKRKYIRSKKAC